MAQAVRIRGGRIAQAKVSLSPCLPLQTPDNVAAAFISDGRGGGVLDLGYWGPLSGHDPIWARVSERRSGRVVRTRDVMMAYQGKRAFARLSFAPGQPLEGAFVAFYALIEGGHRELWDSAGRPMGRYQVDLSTGLVAAC